MKNLIISNGPYPNQHAAAIRHSTIAQGVAEAGHSVEFFILGKQDWKEKSINYNGVTYKSVWLYMFYIYLISQSLNQHIF